MRKINASDLFDFFEIIGKANIDEKLINIVNEFVYCNRYCLTDVN